ncbi:hypothetical protein BH10ACT11_BH10ACT11_03550 [soil metagenome]
MLSIEPSERLLDVATGSAALLDELARRPAPPRQAIGIDSSAEMLALAPDLPFAWQLQLGDATELSYPDHSFDVITASYLLHVVEADQRRRMIAEMARVLRPGGRLGLITISPPRGALAKATLAPVVAAAMRSQGRLAGMRPLDPGPDLCRSGFTGLARRRTLRGYPSLCLVARRGGAENERASAEPLRDP